jgi:polygalacturonase
LICLTRCQHVHIADLHLRKQAVWCLHLLYCQDVDVENLDIDAVARIPSSDGIDVDSSREVRISHCTIACNDDDIAIKSGKDADGARVNLPSENITISDCNIGVGGGITMGSEVTGSIRHVLVQHCTFTNTDNAARFKSQPSRGGVIEDVVFRDIALNNANEAFEFDMAWDLRLEHQPPAKVLTDCRNIQLIRFTGTARRGGIMSGLPGRPIHDVKFLDCAITTQTPLRIENAENIDTSGLKITGPQGPPILWAAPTTQPAQ